MVVVEGLEPSTARVSDENSIPTELHHYIVFLKVVRETGTAPAWPRPQNEWITFILLSD